MHTILLYIYICLVHMIIWICSMGMMNDLQPATVIWDHYDNAKIYPNGRASWEFLEVVFLQVLLVERV